MKKLFALTAVIALAIALMAQEPAARPAAEKTCAEWQAAGLCPLQWRCGPWLEDGTCPRDTEGIRCRQLIEEGRCPVRWTCAEIQERGRCPLYNARAEAQLQRTDTAAQTEEPPRRQCARAQGLPCCGRHRRAAAEAAAAEAAAAEAAAAEAAAAEEGRRGRRSRSR